MVREEIDLHKPHVASGFDELSVLTHSANLLAKKWLADGSMQAYDNPMQFSRRTAHVDGIESLAVLLTEQATDSKSCVIRGRYLGDAVAVERNPEDFKPGKVLRRKTCFADQPLHAVMIDVDKYEPFEADPVTEPVDAIEEYIQTSLPGAFAHAS
jgi:putative DNA primase/helicase